jgi:hypothetical protein
VPAGNRSPHPTNPLLTAEWGKSDQRILLDPMARPRNLNLECVWATTRLLAVLLQHRIVLLSRRVGDQIDRCIRPQDATQTP